MFIIVKIAMILIFDNKKENININKVDIFINKCNINFKNRKAKTYIL